MYKTLTFGEKGGVGTITLNRPERLNAISYETNDELTELLGEIEKSDEIKVVIITGEGRAFCAGADIKAIQEDPDKYSFIGLGKDLPMFNKLADLPKPTVAAINGPANGGGLEVALACDFRIAAENASFGLGEIKIGVLPMGGGTVRLPRLVGIAKAKEMILLGEIIDAQEAYKIGLVNKIVPLESLITECEELANALASRPAVAVRVGKSCIDIGMNMSRFDALEYEVKSVATLWNTEDRTEGMNAFVERRQPVFKGR